MPSVPEFHHLKVFTCVIEERSVSGGARAAGLSQPTVSGHLATLEKQLGVRLFDRIDGEIRPTEAGTLLYTHALDLLRRRRDALDELAALKGGAGGTIDVGGSNIPGVYALPGIIQTFQREHDGVEVSLTVGDSQQMIDAVESGALDVAVVGGEPPKGHCLARPAGRDRLVLIVGMDHAWAGAKKLAVADLANEPMLLRERGSGSRRLIESALRDAGLTLEAIPAAGVLGSNEAIKQAVMAGLGWSLVSERSIGVELEAKRVRTVPVTGVAFERPFYVITDRRRSATALRRAFEDQLIATLGA
jgi:DNA-binding transcriptional LysR family regulator